MRTTSKKHAESALAELIDRIRRSEAFPTISRYLNDINLQLAADPNDSNASDLSTIILKDHALTSKLLKMVNSAFYGLAGGKVSTVTRAVVVLGYEKIRLATLNLALFEHFKSKSHSTHLKEAVVGSFWSGLIAREIAELEVGCVDPEEAFVCSMMSQLGKLVIICYLPDAYHEIINKIAETGVSEPKAVKSTCGVTYEELGVTVAKQWNFPPQVCESMQPIGKAALKSKKNPPAKLRIITDFTKTLYNTIYAGNTPVTTAMLQTLIAGYEPHITVSKQQLSAMIKDSLDNVHRHAQALSLNVSQSVFLDRLMAADDPQHRPSRPSGNTEPAVGAGTRFDFKAEDQRESDARIPGARDPKDIIMDGIQELSQIMLDAYDMRTIADTSLEILYRALDVQRVMMFIQNSTDKKMSVHFGCGHDCQQLIGKLYFDMNQSNDLFSISLQVGKDLIVADAYDEKICNLVPSWFRQKINAPSFLFLPIALQNKCIGALYADRDTAGTPVSETEHRYLDMLRNQIALSIKYKQG